MTPHDLIAAFDTLAEAPDGVARLRELVLDLAVRGRLVSQDGADEGATDLLKRVMAEKERPIAEKKIPKSKAEPLAVSKVEIPFDVPTGWMWTFTAALGLLNPRNEADDDAIVSFCPMPVIPIDYREKIKPEQRRWGDIRKGYTHFADGDVVVAKITPCFQNRKSCVVENLEGGIGAGTTELHVIRPLAGVVNPKYLLLFYKSPMFLVGGVNRMTGTAGQQRVPREYFAGTPLPLPPLAEQHRIVAKVDELMGLLDRLEDARNKRETVRTASRDSALAALREADTPEEVEVAWNRVAERMDELFTKPDDAGSLRESVLQLAVRGRLVEQDPHDEPASVTLTIVAKAKKSGQKTTGRDWVGGISESVDAAFVPPRGWSWVRIAHAVERVTVGYVGPMKSHYVEHGIPFLRSQNVRANRFSENGLIYISPEFHQTILKSALSPGDVVVVRSGNVGTACVIPSNLSEANCSDLVVIKNPMAVLSTYLCFYLNSLAATHVEAGTVGIALTHFNTKSVATMPIPIPPFAEQHRIVAKVDELMELIDRLENHLDRKQITHDAFAAAAVHHLDS